jgi:hypothetical protein
MFIVYAIPIGLLAGFLLGGRLAGLASLEIRWAWLAVTGFAIQVVLFSGPVSERIGDAGPPIYVLSTALVLLAVAANARVRGMPLVIVGAACNLAAIVANGGYMPASPEAVAAIGREEIVGYSNSRVIASPALEPLTDVIVLPGWLPFANIISIGDLLIGVGIAVVVAAAMRSGRSAESLVESPESDAGDDAERALIDSNSPV